MRAILLLSAGALLAGSLSGCGPVNRGLESANQPVVQRTDYTLDLHAGGDGLASGEDRRLAGWFDTLRLGFGDRVTVDDAGHAATAGSRDAVGSIAARYGLLLGDTPPVTAGDVGPGTIRVVVSRSKASVPNCPAWAAMSQPNFDASTDSDYGCATNTNLAMMVADPQDLLRGRTEGNNVSTRATTRSLKAYNELIPTGVAGTVKAESAKGAK